MKPSKATVLVPLAAYNKSTLAPRDHLPPLAVLLEYHEGLSQSRLMLTVATLGKGQVSLDAGWFMDPATGRAYTCEAAQALLTELRGRD